MAKEKRIAKRKRKWSRNSSIINSLIVCERYSELPNSIEENVDLIKIVYPEGSIGYKHVDRLPENQIYGIAERILFDANKNLTNYGYMFSESSPLLEKLRNFRDLLCELAEFERSLKRGLRNMNELSRRRVLGDSIKNLDEEICSQLESCNLPNDSIILREYNGWKSYWETFSICDHKEKMSLYRSP